MIKHPNSNDLSRPLLIIGCGGHAAVVTEIAETLGFCEIFYLLTVGSMERFLGRPVHASLPRDFDGFFFCAIGDNAARESVHFDFAANHPLARPLSLIHPSSVISPRCTIGEGAVVMPLCVVNAGAAIGPGVIINTRASVDHDCKLAAFCSLAPGAVLGGNVQLGHRSAISIGAVIRHGIRIGDDVVIGAGSVVMRDVSNATVAYGVPARWIRSRMPGDPYL